MNICTRMFIHVCPYIHDGICKCTMIPYCMCLISMYHKKSTHFPIIQHRSLIQRKCTPHVQRLAGGRQVLAGEDSLNKHQGKWSVQCARAEESNCAMWSVKGEGNGDQEFIAKWVRKWVGEMTNQRLIIYRHSLSIALTTVGIAFCSIEYLEPGTRDSL